MGDKNITSQVNFEILSHEGNSVTFRRILAEDKVGKAKDYKGQIIPKVVVECFSGTRLLQLKKAQALSIKKQRKKRLVLSRIIEKI